MEGFSLVLFVVKVQIFSNRIRRDRVRHFLVDEVSVKGVLLLMNDCKLLSGLFIRSNEI